MSNGGYGTPKADAAVQGGDVPKWYGEFHVLQHINRTVRPDRPEYFSKQL